MKKIIFTASVLLTLFACQNNADETTKEYETTSKAMRKADVVENFKRAITEINKPQYAPSKKHIEMYGTELSDERKQVLLQPAKDLILASGVTPTDLEKVTINDILNKAFKIYDAQTSYKPTNQLTK